MGLARVNKISCVVEPNLYARCLMSLSWREAFNQIHPSLPKKQLQERIRNCETAIFERFEQLQHENPNGELHEIALAAKTIRMLQVEKLGYPRICSASRLAFNAVITEARAVPTKVLLVDYSGVVLTGIQRLLANYPDISVVGAVPTLEEGIRLAEEFHPDVTVFDLSMSDRGPSARKQTQTLIASSKKVLCISLLREDDVSPLLAAIGVSQYVDKVNLSQELPDAIRKAPQVGKPNIT